MSIPKEPRQLMINIMYLVLTALLALNVSAEIFNAFKMVDKGLVKSNTSLEESNNKMPQLIKDGAKKRESLAKYAERVDPIREKSAELTSYLDGIVDKMIADTEGYVVNDAGEETDELRGKKNFDITTRTLVEDQNGKPGLGPELKEKLEAYRDEIMTFIDEEDRDDFSKNVAIQLDDETWKKKKKKSWSHFNFGHMPLQAVKPIFTKFVNDIKATEAAALNYLANKVGTTVDVTFDEYAVVSAPSKSYIIKGEQYKADLFLTASAGSDSKTGISISVNGKTLPMGKDGKAQYVASAGSVGVKKYTAVASLTNPVTGETKQYKSSFEYEVGERSVAISPTKMNVFYIGVDNPIEVSAAGVPSNQIKVAMGGQGGGTIKKNSDGTYTVNVKTPTKKGDFAKVNVTAPGMTASKDFRVKRIPNPVPKVGRNRGGAVKSGEFKISKGVYPDLESFDFDAKCRITEYVFVRAAKRQDPIITRVTGTGKWDAKVQGSIAKTKPGDRYFIENIKCKCPGDAAARDLGSISFVIR